MIFIRNRQSSDQASQPGEGQPDASQHWVHLAEALAKRWEALTVADLAQVQHKISRLAEVVQERYQVTVEDARQQVFDFEQSLAYEAKLAYAALGSKVSEIRERGSKFRHDVAEYGWQVMAERTVAHYPGYAVGVAALLGLAIGTALGAATRRERRW